MIGEVVVVMPGPAFQDWLGANGNGASGLAEAGSRLFVQYGCGSCGRVHLDHGNSYARRR